MTRERDQSPEAQLARNVAELTRTIGINNKLLKAGLPQAYDPDELMKRYAVNWDQLRALVREYLGFELGDKRVTRMRLDDVLRLDELYASRGGAGHERKQAA